MKGKVVATRSLPSYELVSTTYGSEIVHRVRVMGAIDLEKRLPLYRATLEINETSRYFCVLDNSEGHDNAFSYADMVALDRLLVDSGIDYFCGATITKDPDYSNLVKLADVSAETTRLKADLLATNDPEEAEAFVMERLRQRLR